MLIHVFSPVSGAAQCLSDPVLGANSTENSVKAYICNSGFSWFYDSPSRELATGIKRSVAVAVAKVGQAGDAQ